MAQLEEKIQSRDGGSLGDGEEAGAGAGLFDDGTVDFLQRLHVVAAHMVEVAARRSGAAAPGDTQQHAPCECGGSRACAYSRRFG